MGTQPEARIEDQVAVVTGAARGIGRAIAERLAGMGAMVVLNARDQAQLEKVRQQIKEAGGRALVEAGDLRHPEMAARIGSRVRQLGRCDVLVNCAGIAHAGEPIHQMEVERFDEVIATNLRAPFLLIRTLAPMMIEARSGHIVNISSLAGKNPLAGGAAYSASKWALNGLTYSVAEELRQYGIRVSVVAPGSVNTDFGGSARAERAADERAMRKLQPEDIAAIVAMLVAQPPRSFISEVLVRPTLKP